MPFTAPEYDVLAKSIHEWSVSCGWWEQESNRDWEELMILVSSEVAEALEEWRNGKLPSESYYVQDKRGFYKPEGVPSELADVVIRILDVAAFYGLALDVRVHNLRSGAIPLQEFNEEPATFAGYLNRINYWIALAGHLPIGFTEINEQFKNLASAYLSRALFWVEVIADKHEFSILHEVEYKMSYNRTRERRHGGKIA